LSYPTAEELLELAWDVLPHADKWLLAACGANRWKIVDRDLGEEVADLLRSAGHVLSRKVPAGTLAAWVPTLRLVLIDERHPAIVSAGAVTRQTLLTWAAWHEWGHALSLRTLPTHDPREGERLLRLAPDGIKERIRRAGYAPGDFLHELFAETYAVLMRERAGGRSIPPPWLPDELYQLVAASASG
jgi:hypothetical protein